MRGGAFRFVCRLISLSNRVMSRRACVMVLVIIKRKNINK